MRQYHFVSAQLNWTDAQSLCRRRYTDLATVENAADVDDVLNLTSNFTGESLKQDPKNLQGNFYEKLSMNAENQNQCETIAAVMLGV